ncbi:hypothetical protein ACIGXF_21665 [Streptomyces sp. NPDC053086]|uniref:hypothetical protein n=1 Tax=unclassified Streptomyces TaxID=2593676 RepID=UPI0037CD6DDA
MTVAGPGWEYDGYRPAEERLRESLRLAVQSAGGDADVQVGGVRRESLQHVEQVQAQDATAPPSAACSTAGS